MKQLPERTKPAACARCGSALTEAWHGFFDLHLTVPNGISQEEHDRLTAIVRDVARRLCWECLDDAVSMLLAWRDRKKEVS